MGTLIVLPKRKKKRVYSKFTVPSGALAFGSNPIEAEFELSIDAIERGARKVLCRRQVACTTFAAAADWTSFKCSNCAVEEPLSVDENRLDLDGLADLLRWISTP
jgi:hypothetical protein